MQPRAPVTGLQEERGVSIPSTTPTTHALLPSLRLPRPLHCASPRTVRFVFSLARGRKGESSPLPPPFFV